MYIYVYIYIYIYMYIYKFCMSFESNIALYVIDKEIFSKH